MAQREVKLRVRMKGAVQSQAAAPAFWVAPGWRINKEQLGWVPPVVFRVYDHLQGGYSNANPFPF